MVFVIYQFPQAGGGQPQAGGRLQYRHAADGELNCGPRLLAVEHGRRHGHCPFAASEPVALEHSRDLTRSSTRTITCSRSKVVANKEALYRQNEAYQPQTIRAAPNSTRPPVIDTLNQASSRGV